MGEEDFIPFPGNQEAYAWITHWPQWPSHGLVLHGAQGSGKTHLAHIWSRRATAQVFTAPAIPTTEAIPQSASIVLENADTLAGNREQEETLFHLLNTISAQQGKASILLTAQRAPVLWPLVIPDLRSRLLALPTAQISQPDDKTLAALIGKLFADRQIRVPAEVISYLVRLLERSYSAALNAVTCLDEAALTRKQAITLPLARTVLEQQDLISG